MAERHVKTEPETGVRQSSEANTGKKASALRAFVGSVALPILRL